MISMGAWELMAMEMVKLEKVQVPPYLLCKPAPASPGLGTWASGMWLMLYTYSPVLRSRYEESDLPASS